MWRCPIPPACVNVMTNPSRGTHFCHQFAHLLLSFDLDAHLAQQQGGQQFWTLLDLHEGLLVWDRRCCGMLRLSDDASKHSRKPLSLTQSETNLRPTQHLQDWVSLQSLLHGWSARGSQFNKSFRDQRQTELKSWKCAQRLCTLKIQLNSSSSSFKRH